MKNLWDRASDSLRDRIGGNNHTAWIAPLDLTGIESDEARITTPTRFISDWVQRHYAEAIRLIAEKAPLRILPGELLAGAATLKEAMWHCTPLTPFPSISHTTLGFEKILRIGLSGIRAELDARFALMSGEFRRLFIVLEAALKLSPAA